MMSDDEPRSKTRKVALAERNPPASLDASLFACHKSPEGREEACAGWLATVGIEHLGVRVAVATGQLPAEALAPGENWPDLHETYDEMVEAKVQR
jgi:hypothetical protein